MNSQFLGNVLSKQGMTLHHPQTIKKDIYQILIKEILGLKKFLVLINTGICLSQVQMRHTLSVLVL